MDLLGYIWKASRDTCYSDSKSDIKNEGWHATPMLLGRVYAPLDQHS